MKYLILLIAISSSSLLNAKYNLYLTINLNDCINCISIQPYLQEIDDIVEIVLLFPEDRTAYYTKFANKFFDDTSINMTIQFNNALYNKYNKEDQYSYFTFVDDQEIIAVNKLLELSNYLKLIKIISTTKKGINEKDSIDFSSLGLSNKIKMIKIKNHLYLIDLNLSELYKINLNVKSIENISLLTSTDELYLDSIFNVDITLKNKYKTFLKSINKSEASINNVFSDGTHLYIAYSYPTPYYFANDSGNKDIVVETNHFLYKIEQVENTIIAKILPIISEERFDIDFDNNSILYLFYFV
jgi:hypothetical protein